MNWINRHAFKFRIMAMCSLLCMEFRMLCWAWDVYILHDYIYLTQTNVETDVDSGVRRHMASMG